jgi:hypothetical protein
MQGGERSVKGSCFGSYEVSFSSLNVVAERGAGLVDVDD